MSTDRRGFLSGFAAFGASMLAAVRGTSRAVPGDDYHPVGRVVAGTIEAPLVDYVTLDGRRLSPDCVTECDDVQGWVRYFEEPGREFVHRTGEVRVYWRSPTHNQD